MAVMQHEIKINAPRESVFASLSNVGALRAWQGADTSSEDGKSILGQGDVMRVDFPGRPKFRWRFTHVQPSHHLAWECIAGPHDAAGKAVAFELGDAGGGRTIVTIVHHGWTEGDPAFAHCNTLWGALLGQLKHYVEHGQTQKAVA